MRILLHPTTSYSQPTRIPIASYRLLLASYPQECASSSCFTGLPGDVWTPLDSGSSQFRDLGFWTTLSHLARPARLHLNLLDLYVCILLCHILLDLVRLNFATPDSGRPATSCSATSCSTLPHLARPRTLDDSICWFPPVRLHRV